MEVRRVAVVSVVRRRVNRREMIRDSMMDEEWMESVVVVDVLMLWCQNEKGFE